MPRLISVNKRVGYKLLGGSFPPATIAYIELYVMAQNKTKTDILKQLIDKWVETMEKQYPKEAIIRDIVEKFKYKKAEEEKKSDYDLETFKKEVVKFFEYTSIDKDLAKSIIRKVFKDDEKK